MNDTMSMSADGDYWLRLYSYQMKRKVITFSRLGSNRLSVSRCHLLLEKAEQEKGLTPGTFYVLW